MSATELKKKLVNKINGINDISLLKALDTILTLQTAESSDKPYQLSDEQKETIRISKEQIKNGQFKNNNQVLSNAREWLKSK